MSTAFNFEHALALHQQGELENAKNIYQQILDLDPHHYNSLHLLGLIHHQLGDSQTAASLVSQAIGINSTHSLMHSNLAAIFEKLQRWADALTCWNKVIELEPKNHLAFHNRANIFVKINKPYHAVLDYYHATVLMPNFAEAHYSLGNLRLFELKHLDMALQSYRRAFSITPEQELLFGMYLQAKTNLCDWGGVLEEFSEFEKKLEEQKPITVPFVALHITDRSDLHLIAAKTYAQIKNPSIPHQTVSSKQHSNRRLKIGYYSSDFRNHPVAHLIVELFELHNRDQFEIYGFSFFPGDKKTLNQRIYNSFDHFYDVSDMSEDQIVELSKKLDIDIAIDLNGYTQHAKTNIFSRRCAPLQVSYLGYPGTMGVNNYDYILADQIVIPECDQKNYTEKIIYLPNSYQINDRKRVISNRVFERKEFNLPKEAFVFCCFNHNYKIQPKLFDSWMRILSAVDVSVLWLLEDNPTASLNLKKEAQIRGVNPNRLIFTKRIRMDEHLARQQLADLFLDTLPYNAHTTASDALWVGLPVLTCLGKSFAGRVAASLLEAIKMPELITKTPLDYEKKAIELALNPSKLTQIKSLLSINRNTTPLFDTENSVRNIELSYSKIYNRYEEGLDPISFHVESQSSQIENIAGEKMLTNNKNGFSLIELLVVVAIIGVLSAIGIVGYSKYLDSAKDKVVVANVTQLSRALAAENIQLSTCNDPSLLLRPDRPIIDVYKCAQFIVTQNGWLDSNKQGLILSVAQTPPTQPLTIIMGQCSIQRDPYSTYWTANDGRNDIAIGYTLSDGSFYVVPLQVGANLATSDC